MLLTMRRGLFVSLSVMAVVTSKLLPSPCISPCLFLVRYEWRELAFNLWGDLDLKLGRALERQMCNCGNLIDTTYLLMCFLPFFSDCLS